MNGDQRRALDARRRCGPAASLFAAGAIWLALVAGADPLLAAEAPKAAASRPAVGSDLLQFTDGSGFHGKLLSIRPSEGIGWERPDANAPLHFRATNVAWIRFEKPKIVTAADKPTCRFRFANGDEVFGDLTSIDENRLEMSTWFGGHLATTRQALQSIAILSKGYSVVYEGPTSPEGWVQGKNPQSWEYRDGTFIATSAGTLGRDFKLSGSSSFGFDLAWNGHFSLILALYTTLLDRFDYSTSCYMFYLSPGYISLQRVQGGAGAMNLGQTAIPEMAQKNRLRLEIRANKEENTLGVLVDGHLVQRWKDAAGFVGQGPGALFFAQLDGPSIKVSNVKVAQWEGETILDTVTNAPAGDDLILLVNRDKVSGRLQSVRDGQMKFMGPQTPLEIPLARVSHILFAQPASTASVARPWGLRAYFAGGGTVAFELTEWKAAQLTGRSDNFGDVVLDPQYIRQLQFNLNRAKLDDAELELQDQEVWDIE